MEPTLLGRLFGPIDNSCHSVCRRPAGTSHDLVGYSTDEQETTRFPDAAATGVELLDGLRREGALMKSDLTSGTVMVLGGGGVGGIAWMTGLLVGIAEEGIPLPALVEGLIGTSAGATVAAQVSSGSSLHELYSRQTDPARQVDELSPDAPLVEAFQKFLTSGATTTDKTEIRRHVGEFALHAPTVTEPARRSVIAARLPSHAWPDRILRLVAVNARTCEPVVFDRQSGVDLVDAVAASCAVPGIWPPVTVGPERFVDGGVRSSDNADLAAGASAAIVISPLGGESSALPGDDLAQQLETLRANGTNVFLLQPDEQSRTAIGKNPLLPSSRAPAAEAGRRQGRAAAADLGQFLAGVPSQ